MKKVASIVVLTLAVIGWASWYFLSNLDRFVAETIAVEGTRALGTEVNVQDVSIRLRDGTASIGGLTVANPDGYSHPYAFELNQISVEIDYDTGEVVRIHVQRPVVVAEAVGLKNNFSELVDQMPEPRATSRATAGGADSDDGLDSSGGGDEGDAPKPTELTIRLIEVEEATAILESDLLDESREFVVSKLVMENISGTSEQVARQIAQELLASVSRQVLIEVAKAQAGEELQRATERAEELLQGLFE